MPGGTPAPQRKPMTHGKSSPHVLRPRPPKPKPKGTKR